MIALEKAIEFKLEEIIPEVIAHDRATALLRSIQTISNDHKRALETRFQNITETLATTNDDPIVFPINEEGEKIEYPASTALQVVYTILNQAVIGYAVLHPLATRFLDSSWIADEGTSYHLTRQHTQDYVQAIQEVSRLIHEVVLWELDNDGYECKCVCPSCGIGICLCSMAGRDFLSETWLEAGPIFKDVGIYVQLPKQNSPAARAGLVRGDIITAIGGQEIESFWDIQSAVRNSEPGEEIQLTLQRDSHLVEQVDIIND